ncbi:MAG TPA: ribonuclease P protein component [Patescibacteria group bacterium]|nr:ribonuclease P protein component [Patescibacteria group bacterium]
MIHSTHRFHGRSSLRFVYQKGSTARGELPLAMRYAVNPRSQTWRVAVVVSRKVSKAAVVRNRIRRRIFEIVRKDASRLKPPIDIVFTAYDPAIAEMDHATLERAVLQQLERAGVLERQRAGANHDIVNQEETIA